MAMFTAHIAFILEVLALAAGLIILHYACKLHAKLIKAAGILLVIFSISGILCTGYYAMKYFLMGHYEHTNDLNITIEDPARTHHYHCGDVEQ